MKEASAFRMPSWLGPRRCDEANKATKHEPNHGVEKAPQQPETYRDLLVPSCQGPAESRYVLRCSYVEFIPAMALPVLSLSSLILCYLHKD